MSPASPSGCHPHTWQLTGPEGTHSLTAPYPVAIDGPSNSEGRRVWLRALGDEQVDEKHGVGFHKTYCDSSDPP